MKSKSVILLPKTKREIPNGGIYFQHVRCGKSNCRCRSGERHIAAYFLIRINGKQKKKYVRKAEIDAIRSLVEAARRDRKEFGAARLEGMLTYRAIKSLLASLGD